MVLTVSTGFVSPYLIFEDINVGDEGGFAPDLSTVEECLDLLVETIAHCGFEGKVAIALDVAASGKSLI